jgi:hypothetical protein
MYREIGFKSMLRISKGTKYLYTLKDIIEYENPELWNRAQAQSKRFAHLQEMVISVLSSRRKQLPKDGEQLKDVDGQIAFLSYILACSLYAFADEVNKLLDAQCASYAKYVNTHETYDADVALDDIKKTLDILEGTPIESLLNDHVSGLHRLSALTCRFNAKMDFGVFKVASGYWMFSDIMGMIICYGMSDVNMLLDAINDIPPTSVSVTELLDDDTMQRVY